MNFSFGPFTNTLEGRFQKGISLLHVVFLEFLDSCVVLKSCQYGFKNVGMSRRLPLRNWQRDGNIGG